MIGESSFKEGMPCKISPLGFYLTKTKSDKQAGECTEEDRRRAIPKTFQNWLQAFCIYVAVMGERFPSKCSGLFQHLDIIAEAFRHFGGYAWYTYDENVRQKLAVPPSLHWGSKDVGLWLNYYYYYSRFI